MYTVNVMGNERTVELAERAGYHAYRSGKVVAIETHANTKEEAIKIAKRFGRVLYAFI